jgi:hypothetical protein
MTTSNGSLWNRGAGGSGSASSLKTNQTTITADTTITSVNQIYAIDSSNNNITITLPANANSGDIIKLHHEAFANNSVNIINPAFPSSLFEIKNAIQTTTCVYAKFLNEPHWTIEGTVIDESGNIASPFKEQIIQTAVASQFYLSDQALIGGKSLLVDQSILTAGEDLFNYIVGDPKGDVIQRFFTPSLNRTTLKRGIYSARVYGNLVNPPADGDFSLLIDINVVDINGNKTQGVVENLNPINNKKFPLNEDTEAFDFTYLPLLSLTINATDRLELVVKFKSTVNQSVLIYYGRSEQNAYIITPIDKKDELGNGKIFLGGPNNEAQQVSITGDAGINNAGVITINPQVITGTKIANATITGSNIAGNTIAGSSILNNTDINGLNFLKVNEFQCGPATLGGIKARFSGSYAYAYNQQYGYLSANGFGTIGGNLSANFSLEVNNRLLCGSEINVVSDERAKTDIQPLDELKALEMLLKIQAKTYMWNDGREDKNTKIGWIAQEVGEAGLGEAITIIRKDLNGEILEDYHVLDKEQMSAVLWAACRALLNKLDNLEKQNQSLENRLKIIEEMLL